jgi:hypothetical protein
MSRRKKFPAQNGRAGAPENGAIVVDLDTERPTMSESNIFRIMFYRCVSLGTDAVELVDQRVAKRSPPTWQHSSV